MESNKGNQCIYRKGLLCQEDEGCDRCNVKEQQESLEAVEEAAQKQERRHTGRLEQVDSNRFRVVRSG